MLRPEFYATLKAASNSFFASILLLAFSATAGTFQGKVISVTDGDTIKVLDSNFETQVIRLLGIDAPEKKQAFGQQSKQHLSGLVFGQNVTVQWQLKDRDDRILGKVLATPLGCATCDMTLDVNLAQVSAGYAWWYHHFARNQSISDRALYEHSEQSARALRLGLWSDTNPIAPWDWRKGRRY